jgi:hypothetical protein
MEALVTRSHTWLVGTVLGLAAVQGVAAGVLALLRANVDAELRDTLAANAANRSSLAQAPAAPLVEPRPAPAPFALLDAPDVAGTLQRLQAIGDGDGVTFDGVKAAPSTAGGRQPFQLTVRGTPRQVCSFLATLEQHDRLLVVESGRVAPAPGDTLAVELGVATFHRGGAR